MYKKIFLIILFILIHPLIYLLVADYAYGATPTPADPAQEIKDQLITNIASRVAQLKLVEKRGIIGKVTESTNTQITITDFQNNVRFVDVDELTKFSSPKAKETFGISDITKNTTVGILGLYNKESRRILARFVNVTTTPLIVHGKVTAIDNESFTISMVTKDGKQMTVDVENITRTFSYTSTDDYVRSGFSKIKVNYNIIAAGTLDTANNKKMTATRVIFFPEIPAPSSSK